MFNKSGKKGMTERECQEAERDYTRQKLKEFEAVLKTATSKYIELLRATDININAGVSIYVSSPGFFDETNPEQRISIHIRYTNGPCDTSFFDPFNTEIIDFIQRESGYTVKLKPTINRLLTNDAILERAKKLFSDEFDIALNLGNISMLKKYGVTLHNLARCELEGEDIL